MSEELTQLEEELRDTFAIAAMGGMLSNSACRGGSEWLAVNAYYIADTMMDERKKRREKRDEQRT